MFSPNLTPEIYGNLISRRLKLCSCIWIFSFLSTLTIFVSKFLTGKYQIEQNNLESVCKILGSVNQDEMRSLYQIADLSVSLPLRAEGFGRTISESLYSKTPLLAFDYGGVKNQLSNLSEIFKVKPRDYQSLPAKIEKLLVKHCLEKREKFN